LVPRTLPALSSLAAVAALRSTPCALPCRLIVASPAVSGSASRKQASVCASRSVFASATVRIRFQLSLLRPTFLSGSWLANPDTSRSVLPSRSSVSNVLTATALLLSDRGDVREVDAARLHVGDRALEDHAAGGGRPRSDLDVGGLAGVDEDL